MNVQEYKDSRKDSPPTDLRDSMSRISTPAVLHILVCSCNVLCVIGALYWLITFLILHSLLLSDHFFIPQHEETNT